MSASGQWSCCRRNTKCHSILSDNRESWTKPQSTRTSDILHSMIKVSSSSSCKLIQQWSKYQPPCRWSISKSWVCWLTISGVKKPAEKKSLKFKTHPPRITQNRDIHQQVVLVRDITTHSYSESLLLWTFVRWLSPQSFICEGRCVNRVCVDVMLLSRLTTPRSILFSPVWCWSYSRSCPCDAEVSTLQRWQTSFSSCLSCWFINCRFPCFMALSEADCPEEGCGEDATMSFYIFGQLCLPISFFGLEYACRHMLAERIILWPIYYRINLRQGVTVKPQNGVAVRVLKMLLQSVITIVITMLLQ